MASKKKETLTNLPSNTHNPTTSSSSSSDTSASHVLPLETSSAPPWNFPASVTQNTHSACHITYSCPCHHAGYKIGFALFNQL
ncbi:hypothetical protein VNO80_02158 [Phaseolus coccineus]|uniref:Uncharacterized protein n=1 Tax=Phaseolus coccineus TaxID=3886 RepID=A0AAN9RMN6_PHACN